MITDPNLTRVEKMKIYRKRYVLKNKGILVAKKRKWRLAKRKAKLAGKHCLNCDILLTERLVDKGRSYLYCRKCILEYGKEIQRDRIRRYYYRKQKAKKAYLKTPLPTISWRTLKGIEARKR